MPVLTVRLIPVIRALAEVGCLCIRLDQRPGFSRVVRVSCEISVEPRRFHPEQAKRLAITKRGHHPGCFFF